MNLTEKKCVPCEGGMPPLNTEEVADYAAEIDAGWVVQANTMLSREYEFSDFKSAVSFVNKVGQVAEDEGHHPNLYLYNYKQLRIELTTHAIGGLSENDFILAAKIDQLV